MSIWGAVIGGAAGFFLGGPLGGLMGAVAGHAVGKAKAEMSGAQGTGRIFTNEARVEDRQAAFAVAVVVLGAKMAKADGVVTHDEIAAFKEVFRIPDEEAVNVGRLFNEAKLDAQGFEPYAAQIADMFSHEPSVLGELLGGLFHIAKADNVIHPAELTYLQSVAAIFGLSEAAFETIRARHMPSPGSSPYTVLGISPDASDEDVKKTYRKLLRENHPDALMAKGMPAEFVEVANKKMATINAAYDEVRAGRGLK